MFWDVDVSSLGQAQTASLRIEADSWQKALQAARSQRGEPTAMGTFSIELVEEGCRAIDQASQIRYDVRQHRENGALPPRPAKKTPSTPGAPVTRTAVPASTSPAPAPKSVSTLKGEAPTRPAKPGKTEVPPSRAPLKPETPPATAPPAELLSKREQEATEATPLTYREYVYLVPAGTTEADAERVLRSLLEGVREALKPIKTGKLVNLAAFDVRFQGKPPVPPLVTLGWKDWRGDPVVAFPRRPPVAAGVAAQAPAAAPKPASKPPPPPPAGTPVLAPVLQPSPVPSFPSPTPPVATLAIAPVPEPMPEPMPEPAPAPRAAAPAVVPFVPPPVVILPTETQPAAEVTPPPAPDPGRVEQAAPAAPPPPVARGRLRSEDLIADLFEAMHDLHFVRDALEGGEFCLSLAMEKVPCRVGIVHLYDIDKREFVVTSTRGAGAGRLLLRRHPETDPVIIAAMRRRQTILIADAASSEAPSLQRFIDVGGVQSLIVAPVMQAGRFLGAIELANPLDGQPFTEMESGALQYIAEQFAVLVNNLGVVTDPEKIGARALPEA
jgi:hypothetical protein